MIFVLKHKRSLQSSHKYRNVVKFNLMSQLNFVYLMSSLFWKIMKLFHEVNAGLKYNFLGASWKLFGASWGLSK